LEPDHVPARYSLATTLFNAGRFAAAEAEIRRVLERAPADRNVHFWLGRILHAQGRRSEAAGPLKTAAAEGGDIARWCRLVEATVLPEDFDNF
jgi:Flp pilus assembly protein TadD